MPQEQIKAQFGKVTEMIGGGWLQVQPGEGTDETALLLATAYGIMKNPENPFAEIGKNFIKWAISRPKDISDTTLRSIDKTMSKGHGKHLIPKARWQESAGQVDLFSNRGSVDNGAILNTLYPALYYTDEFNGKRLNAAKWHAKSPYWTNGRPPATFKAENVSVKKGCLRIINTVFVANRRT